MAEQTGHLRNQVHYRAWRWVKKWNESSFRPPLCTYRLNWARRTFWGWWDDWDDSVLQTQDSKFEPWRSEAEHATSRSRRLHTILTFTRGWGRNIFVSFTPPRPGTEPQTLVWNAAVLTTTLGPPPLEVGKQCLSDLRQTPVVRAIDGRGNHIRMQPDSAPGKNWPVFVWVYNRTVAIRKDHRNPRCARWQVDYRRETN